VQYTLTFSLFILFTLLPHLTYAISQNEFVDGRVNVPPEILTSVNALLPEQSNVDSAFLSGDYSPNLVLSDYANVTIYFIWEGAGYKNSLGYFTYEEDEQGNTTITSKQLIFPNASMTDPLRTGDFSHLRDIDGQIRTFEPGTRIGFFLVANGWPTDRIKTWPSNAANVPSSNPATNRSIPTYLTLEKLNPEIDQSQPELAQHVAMVQHTGVEGFLNSDDFMLVGIEDLNRVTGSDNDFNDLVFVVGANPPTAITTESEVMVVDPNDSDGDGAALGEDQFPNDPERASVQNTPSTGMTNIGFEDLYPSKGDADFNDAIVGYRWKVISDSQGRVKDIMSTFLLLARGAKKDHEFGFRLLELSGSMSGSVEIERVFSDDTQTRERLSLTVEDVINAGKRVKVFPSTMEALPPFEEEALVNTTSKQRSRQAAAARVLITFDEPVDPVVVAALPFDLYFGVKNKEGLFDVHMVGKPAFDDRPSILPVEEGPESFTNEDGLPWIIEIPNDWQFPLENVRIGKAYKNFDAWVNSRGTQHSDWYLTSESELLSDPIELFFQSYNWEISTP
jgi:LruC domain-containing protein